MTDKRGSSVGHAAYIREPNATPHIELGIRAASVSAARDSYQNQGHRRRKNYQAVIESPLARLTDEELERDVREFHQEFLPFVDVQQLLRAVQVAKDIRIYDAVARSDDPHAGKDLPVQLTAKEKTALRKEKDSLPSEPTMYIVVLTVSLAAFLQGFVQSSINGASLYAQEFGLDVMKSAGETGGSPPKPTLNDWKLGAVNASPFLFAALVGCPLALPINNRVGRRGAMAIAACLILASSLGAAACSNWKQLFGVRVINGIGMGIKAVSTPILASETAVGYWRGTSILVWQLWVAFGIAIGFAFNLIFWTARNHQTIKQLILGAPFVPAIFLLVGLYFCPESPRYYMRQQSAHFNPQKAYAILVKLRGGEFQALRAIYLIYKSVQQEEQSIQSHVETQTSGVPLGLVAHIRAYATQYKQLFTQRRLRNALVSSSIVSLAQQLCGINVFAFYSGPLFNGLLHDHRGELRPMLYSFGYGAVNFLFGLPAIRTIDTLGRRKWLVLTLPIMCLFMTAAALSTMIPYGTDARGGVVALFVFLFAAAYSPGLGPIPFTLASERFLAGYLVELLKRLLTDTQLSVIASRSRMRFRCRDESPFRWTSINILPKCSLYAGLNDGGTLGLFAGLNLVAFVLVFLLVEETKRRSLEDLNAIFAVRKTRFVRYQVMQYLPWFFRRYFLRHVVPRPELYLDLIWGNYDNSADHHDQGGEPIETGGYGKSNRDDDIGGGNGLFNTASLFARNADMDARRASREDDDHW
ncbi:sugar transporter-domain-containing protein [Xylaria sp. FL0064]|nr:sugar transporter-domain-containing protein [Xylaria sp. FL0064]